MSDEQPDAPTFDELLEHLDDLEELAMSEDFVALAMCLAYARRFMQAAPQIYAHRGPLKELPPIPPLRHLP